MASESFTAADGTSLQTLSANWNENVTGDTKVKSNQARINIGSNRYVYRQSWYANGQPNFQSSQAVLVGEGTPAGGGVRRVLHVQATGARLGYELRITSGLLELRKNGTYLTDVVLTNDLTTSTTYKIAVEDAGGGSVYVRGYKAGSGTPSISYTDASPLTGGYPGFGVYPDGDQPNTDPVGWDDWTDGISAASAVFTKNINVAQAINRASRF